MLAGFETPDTGRILLDGAGHHRAAAEPPQGQHDLPELRAVPAPHGAREHRLRPAGRAAGRRTAIDEEVERMLALTQLEDQAKKKPGADQRGPEAARGDRPRPHQQARRAAARRAPRRPRPQAAPAHADRARPHPRPGRDHVPVRDPRPGRGDEPLRPHRGDEGRPHRAGGPARPRSTRPRARASSPRSSATPTSSRARWPRSSAGDYCRLEVDGFPGIVCFNDKQIGQGRPVSLSLRPEKLRIWRERPEVDRRHNAVPGARRGRDLPRHPHEVLGARAGAPHRRLRAAQPLPARRDAHRAGSRTCGSPGTRTTRSCSRATARRTRR